MVQRTLTWTSACKRTREVSETAVQCNRKIPAESDDVDDELETSFVGWSSCSHIIGGKRRRRCKTRLNALGWSLSRSHRRVCSTLLDNLVCTARVSLRTRRLCWSTEKCTCRVYCRRSRHDGAATRSRKGVGVYSTLSHSPRTLHHSVPCSQQQQQQRAGALTLSSSCLGWECHTGGSRSKPTVHRVLPKREEAVGCSTSPQPRAQWLSHNAARNSASMSTKRVIGMNEDPLPDRSHDRTGQPVKRSDKKLGQISSKRRFF